MKSILCVGALLLFVVFITNYYWFIFCVIGEHWYTFLMSFFFLHPINLYFLSNLGSLSLSHHFICSLFSNNTRGGRNPTRNWCLLAESCNLWLWLMLPLRYISAFLLNVVWFLIPFLLPAFLSGFPCKYDRIEKEAALHDCDMHVECSYIFSAGMVFWYDAACVNAFITLRNTIIPRKGDQNNCRNKNLESCTQRMTNKRIERKCILEYPTKNGENQQCSAKSNGLNWHLCMLNSYLIFSKKTFFDFQKNSTNLTLLKKREISYHPPSLLTLQVF